MEFFKKKEKNVKCKGFKDYEVGDNYTYVAIKRKSRLHVGHVVGKWNEENCIKFWEKIARKFELPTSKYRFNACTDGNKQNKKAFKSVFAQGAVNYGKVKKIKKGSFVIGQIAKVVLGRMSKGEIGIRHVDGYCARLRERLSRYVRKSKTYSKKRTPWEYHLSIFQAYNNFIDIYKDKMTPCMIEGITTKKWEWEDIIMNFQPTS